MNPLSAREGSQNGHLHGCANHAEEQVSDDKGVQSFLRNTATISGSLPCRSQTMDNDLDLIRKQSEQDSPTASKKSLKSFKMVKRKHKRSKSTSALDRKARSSYDSNCSTSFDSSLESLIKHNLSTSKAMQPLLTSKAKERFVI